MDETPRASGATLAAVEEEPPKLEERDFAADPEVQDYYGSLIQAIEEGIVERPPLVPFREMGGASTPKGLEAGCSGDVTRA